MYASRRVFNGNSFALSAALEEVCALLSVSLVWTVSANDSHCTVNVKHSTQCTVPVACIACDMFNFTTHNSTSTQNVGPYSK